MPLSARELLLEHFRWVEGHADVWAIFRDPTALSAVVAGIVDPFRDSHITAICGIESRGFLLGAAAAVELGVGFVPVRKLDGLFPGDKLTSQTDPDYRQRRHTLRLQRSSLGCGDRILLVDDWIETGSQATTAKRMVEQCGSAWIGCSVLVDQLDEERRASLGLVTGLVKAHELPACTPSASEARAARYSAQSRPAQADPADRGVAVQAGQVGEEGAGEVGGKGGVAGRSGRDPVAVELLCHGVGRDRLPRG